MNAATTEIRGGQRFEFGKNWNQFLARLDEERIVQAERSLSQMLSVENLNEKRFLDVGSGSGLFSLAARRLGAQVHSFDYDPQSVACTRELKQRFFCNDPLWKVEEGSVLDEDYLRSLGRFDIVYSWGVLHHTGAMWRALENVGPLVVGGGKLFIAIYNDQGYPSRLWLRIKRFYNHLAKPLRMPILILAGAFLEGKAALGRFIRLENPLPFKHWRRYKRERGMSVWNDLVDWIGGYPFEVAMPEEIFDFFFHRGFDLMRLRTCRGGLGCNEFVFKKR